MNVKILHKIFLLLLLATFMLTSCHDDDEPIDEPTEQTVIFFTNTECQTLCDRAICFSFYLNWLIISEILYKFAPTKV